MPSRFAAVTNKEISQLIKQDVPKVHEAGDEVRFGSFNNCKLSLSLAILYLVDLFINKLKTKFNNLFLQNDFKYKKNSQIFLKKFPRKS